MIITKNRCIFWQDRKTDIDLPISVYRVVVLDFSQIHIFSEKIFLSASLAFIFKTIKFLRSLGTLHPTL